MKCACRKGAAMTDEELKKLYSPTEDGVGEDDEEINSLLWRIRKRVAKNYPVDKPQPVEKKVEYIELFFDLIFVHSLRTINALFHGITDRMPSQELMLTFFFLMAVVLQVWMFTTMFFNRYGRKSIRDYVSIFINMFCLYYMASGSNIRWMEHYIRYHVAFTAILLNLAYRSFDKYMFAPHMDALDKKILKRNYFILLSEAALVVISIFLHEMYGLVLSPFAIMYGYIAKAVQEKLYAQRPCDFPHLAERNLLLVILTFGEMIIGISEYFEVGENFLEGLASFLIVIGMFMAYAYFNDNILDHHKETSGLAFLFIHVLMILAINSTTVALEYMSHKTGPILAKTMWMVMSQFVYYACLMSTEIYAKPKMKRSYGYVGFVLSILLLYVPLMLGFGSNVIVGKILTVFAVYLILYTLIRTHTHDIRMINVGGYIG